jgi:hypothetical protein
MLKKKMDEFEWITIEFAENETEKKEGKMRGTPPLSCE